MLTTYRPSGHIGAMALPIALLAMIVFAVIAWPYQALLDWIPFIYVNVLVTVGYAIVAAIAVMLVVQAGRCRNTTVALLLAILVAGPGLAASHYFKYSRWTARILDEVPAEQQEAVRADIDFATYAKNFTWTLKGSDISGPGVWTIWLVEALIVFACPIGAAFHFSRSPFCEQCGRWTEGPHQIMVRSDQGEEALGRLKSAAVIEELISLNPAATLARFALSYEIQKCPMCAESTYLSINKITVKVKKGKPGQKSQSIRKYVHVGEQDLRRLMESAPQPETGQGST